MRITITCEECGRRHRLERSVEEPGPIWIICHDCELPLRAVLEPEVLRTALADSRFEEAPEGFPSAWADTIDLSDLSSPSSFPTP